MAKNLSREECAEILTANGINAEEAFNKYAQACYEKYKDLVFRTNEKMEPMRLEEMAAKQRNALRHLANYPQWKHPGLATAALFTLQNFIHEGNPDEPVILMDGRHKGKAVSEIFEVDPDYLHWLKTRKDQPDLVREVEKYDLPPRKKRGRISVSESPEQQDGVVDLFRKV